MSPDRPPNEPALSRGGVWLDIAVYLTFIAGLLLYDWEFEFLTLEETGLIGIGLTTYAVTRTATRPPFGPLSCSAVYIAMLCVFHLGLIAALAMGMQPTEHLEEATWRWLYEDMTLRAVRLALLGVAACAAGASLAALTRPLKVPEIPVSNRADFALGQIGAILTIVSVALWFLILLREGGPAVFTGSYAAMLETVKGSRLPTIYLVLHIGVPLLAATRWRWTHTWGWAAFAAFSIAAMMVGVRGRVLFTLAAVAPIRAMLGFQLALWRVVVGGLLLLATVTFVRDVRTVGVADVGQANELSANPLEGMMELGTSIRPVVEVVKWHEAGDDMIWGASYWATIDRPARRLIPGVERIPASQDDRIMNVLVDMRNAGAIGFSPIAEAYRNFGVAGVLLIMGFTGWFIGKLDQLPRTGAWPAMVGLVMIPQLIQVRNSFIHVPFSTLAGVIVLLGTILYFDRLAGKRNHDEPQQRQRERPVA